MKQKISNLNQLFSDLIDAINTRDNNLKRNVAEALMDLSGFARYAGGEVNLGSSIQTACGQISEIFTRKEYASCPSDRLIDEIQEIFSDITGEDAIEIHDKSSSVVRRRVWDLTNGKCTYCKKGLVDGGVGSDSFVVEHIVPKSAGGPDRIENYVPACSACNIKKSNRHVIDAMGDQAVPALKLVQGESA